jgi:phosphoribosylamine--glycine ligase
MNVLVIGSGGREHALAWKIAQSDRCDNIFIAPGNAGTDALGTNLNIDVGDFDGIANAISTHEISLLVIGPEDPLVKGLRDFLLAKPEFKDLLVIGPDAAGAQLEGSKDFSKAFMLKHGVPAAGSKTYTKDTLNDALAYVEHQSLPIVIKADGLAAGKGVIIAQSKEEAKEAINAMLIDNKFAKAGEKVLIEDYLDGIELSVFVLTDGKNYKILPEAKDYKRIGENDTGLNTGGMGAVSPVPFASKEFLGKVEEKVVKPTLAGLAEEGIHYVGFIFIGLMNVAGEPYVIEYNVRMGDPETQVVIPRLKSDLLEVLIATGKGELDKIDLEIEENVATTVVGVAGGYPESYAKGNAITGLEKTYNSAMVFHAGTKKSDGEVLTNGGRVIAVTGSGKSIDEALANSYTCYDSIRWKDMYFRKDIGQDLLRIKS